MSEEKKIYCTQCGNQNDASSKFCSNCGAKLERPDFGAAEEAAKQEEGLFSGGESGSFFEKITDAEEEKPAPIPEIQINYGSSQQSYDNGSYNNSGSYGNNYNNSSYDSGNTGSNSYYNSGQSYYTDPVAEKPGGGNIGFAIASLVCGIISLLCCCLGLFSAVLAIAAIVLGIITLCFKYDGKGMAIAGIATGGVAIAIIIASLIISGTSFYNELINEFVDEFYY